jgi:hypothetical protein
MKDNLLVFALILIASILFFSGCTDSSEKDSSEKGTIPLESASAVARSENGRINLTLISVGDNMPSFGYSLKDSVRIILNGEELSDDNLTGNLGWEEFENLYIGGNPPVLDDDLSNVDILEPGDYQITIIILETVIFDDEVRIF